MDLPSPAGPRENPPFSGDRRRRIGFAEDVQFRYYVVCCAGGGRLCTIGPSGDRAVCRPGHVNGIDSAAEIRLARLEPDRVVRVAGTGTAAADTLG